MIINSITSCRRSCSRAKGTERLSIWGCGEEPISALHFTGCNKAVYQTLIDLGYLEWYIDVERAGIQYCEYDSFIGDTKHSNIALYCINIMVSMTICALVYLYNYPDFKYSIHVGNFITLRYLHKIRKNRQIANYFQTRYLWAHLVSPGISSGEPTYQYSTERQNGQSFENMTHLTLEAVSFKPTW